MKPSSSWRRRGRSGSALTKRTGKVLEAGPLPTRAPDHQIIAFLYEGGKNDADEAYADRTAGAMATTGEEKFTQEQDAAKAVDRKKRKKRKKKQVSEFQALGLQPRLLKMALACKYLSMSVGTLRRLIQAEEIRVVRVGEKTAPWLLDVAELNAWVERNNRKLGD
jgi:excisionase family DNA binding protein